MKQVLTRFFSAKLPGSTVHTEEGTMDIVRLEAERRVSRPVTHTKKK